MIRRDLSLALLCLGAQIGCSAHAMDLDHAAAPPPVRATGADPAVDSEQEFEGVWVDDRRLYWLTSFSSFQSCLKADCEPTMLTYVTSDARQAPLSVAVSEHVYWTLDSTVVTSCAPEGCGSEPVTVTKDHSLQRFFGHRDYLYWSSDLDLYRCPARGCSDTPEVVALGATPYQLIFDDDRAYWIDSAGILSAPIDGSQPSKLLIAWARDGSSMQSLAIGADYLYWAIDERVLRCPIASCNATVPTLLATGGAPVTDLKIDGQTLFWLEGDLIHSCLLPGCERSTVLIPQKVAPGGRSRYAVDASDVYWLEGMDPPSTEPRSPMAKSIRRTAR